MKKNQKDTQRKGEAGWKRAVTEKRKECSTWAFVIDIFYVTFSLFVGVSCWFKAPVMGRISKGPQATRRYASKITTQQPPPLLTTLLPYWLPQPLLNPSASALHQLSSSVTPDLQISPSPSCLISPFFSLSFNFFSFSDPPFSLKS